MTSHVRGLWTPREREIIESEEVRAVLREIREAGGPTPYLLHRLATAISAQGVTHYRDRGRIVDRLKRTKEWRSSFDS
jgi:hypothetical protein